MSMADGGEKKEIRRISCGFLYGKRIKRMLTGYPNNLPANPRRVMVRYRTLPRVSSTASSPAATHIALNQNPPPM
jgi:hypothetical protein